MQYPNDSPVDLTPRRFQFRLSYLLYLLTLCAIGCALVRPILLLRGGWLVTTLGSLYVASLIAYFAIRVPILVRRLRRSTMSLAAKQLELSEFAAARRREPDPKETP